MFGVAKKILGVGGVKGIPPELIKGGNVTRSAYEFVSYIDYPIKIFKS